MHPVGPDGKAQPITPDSRVLRGQAYFAQGKVQEALKEYNATISKWPKYPRAYLERGNVRLSQKQYETAVVDYDAALKLQPNLVQAFMMRSSARLEMKQYLEALADIKEAERLDPDNAHVKVLKIQVRKAQQVAAGVALNVERADGADPDAFASFDTPKSTPSPSIRKVCMVCMDSERECRLRPCMHASLCVECAESLRARSYGCPICNAKIEAVEQGQFMRTFTVEDAQGVVLGARAGSNSSPGKSPLGRTARYGATGQPSATLHNIVEEGDDMTTATSDAASTAGHTPLAADAATARTSGTFTDPPSPHRVESSASLAAQLPGSVLSPARPAARAADAEPQRQQPESEPEEASSVVLAPHPIAARISSRSGNPTPRAEAAAAAAGAAAELLATTAPQDAAAPGNAPGPSGQSGAAAAAAAVAVAAAQLASSGSSSGGGPGSAPAGGVPSRAEAPATAAAAGQRREGFAGGSGGGSGEDPHAIHGEPSLEGSVGVLSLGASTLMAESLADWIQEAEGSRRSTVGGLVSAASASHVAAAAPPPRGAAVAGTQV